MLHPVHMHGSGGAQFRLPRLPHCHRYIYSQVHCHMYTSIDMLLIGPLLFITIIGHCMQNVHYNVRVNKYRGPPELVQHFRL
jgi:hypothetical protein